MGITFEDFHVKVRAPEAGHLEATGRRVLPVAELRVLEEGRVETTCRRRDEDGRASLRFSSLPSLLLPSLVSCLPSSSSYSYSYSSRTCW